MTKEKVPPEIGNRIAQARKQLGLTQREFADALEVSQGLVGAWEAHWKKPGRRTLEKISALTGISMNSLLERGPVVQDSLHITAADEIRLVLCYRALPTPAKQKTLEIAEMTANLARMQNKKRGPAKVEEV